MIVIPLQPVPNQRLSFRHEAVEYDMEIEMRREAFYFSLWMENVNVIHNRVMRSYSPLPEGFMLIDSEGTDEPNYEQLGMRFLLIKQDG